jgi:hypothetical protein
MWRAVVPIVRVAATRRRVQQRIHIGGAAKTHGAQCSLVCCNNARIVRSPACLARFRGGNGGAEIKDNSTRRYRSTTASSVLPWNLYRTGPVVTPYGLEPKEQRCAFGYSSSAMCGCSGRG